MFPSQNISFWNRSLCTVLSQNASFADSSLCTLLLLRPWSLINWSSHKLSSTVPQCSAMLSGQQSLNVPQCFLGRVLFSSAIPCINTQPVAFSCYTIRWSAGYQDVDHLLVVSQQKCITCGQHLGQTLCGMLLATGLPIHCMGSASAGCSGCLYLLWAPHWVPISLISFLSPTHKERLEHWAHGIKELEHWAHGIKDTKVLDLIKWCRYLLVLFFTQINDEQIYQQIYTMVMVKRKGKGKRKDSTINENNQKYKC